MGGDSPDAVVAQTRDILREMRTAASDRAIGMMVLNGSAFLVPQGTHVSVLDRAWDADKVLVMDGPTMGRTGWVPPPWVVADQ